MKLIPDTAKTAPQRKNRRSRSQPGIGIRLRVMQEHLVLSLLPGLSPATSGHAMARLMEDLTLIETANHQGLRAYYDDCIPSLRRLISARMGSRTDAEDLLQELWIKLATLETGPIANPKAYLHRIALNMANDLVRERVRRRGRESAWSDVMVAEKDSIAVDPAPSPERALIAKREMEHLSQALQTLPARSREAFLHHKIEGRSHAEVAHMMGISRSAVEKHMATAMKYLMRAMKVEDWT
jgi:RNA polymerase sigma factor (sigma-70 family)